MRYYITMMIVVLSTIVSIGCKKQGNIVKLRPLSSLTIINVLDLNGPIVVAPNDSSSVIRYLNNIPQLSFGYSQQLTTTLSSVPILLYSYADTSAPLFEGTVTLPSSNVNTLFLLGHSGGQSVIDTLLTQDYPPYHPAFDSTCSIRFVNVSPDVTIKIERLDVIGGPLVSNLSFKGVAAYLTFPATSSQSLLSFKFSQAVTGDSLTTLTISPNPFSNNTVIFFGRNLSGVKNYDAVQVIPM